MQQWLEPRKNSIEMELASLQAALGDKATAGELMSRHTTFAIGGPADLFVVARTPSELCAAVQLAHEHNVPYFILGSGANLLVADKGIRGLVIHNQCAAITIAPNPEGQTMLVQAESGALLRTVARQAMDQDLAGLEWAVDVPGTVGGAVVGNAGAFGGYVSDNLLRALVFSPTEGKPSPAIRWAARWWSKHDLKLGYRTSILKENSKRVGFPLVILEAVFALRQEDPKALKERAAQYTRHRLETQPAGPSAGSVFKRTPQYPAGFLIETAGLKDTRIGGAVISPQHANFIVNVGGATARDVKQLIELMREKVHAQFKIMLELEIELVGDW
jgi:UDP-N-acetylmuramate dehydrogenase